MSGAEPGADAARGPCIAVATNNGEIGGGEVMLLAVAKALAAIGLTPLVLGPAEPGDLVAAAREHGWDAVALPARTRGQYMRELARWRLRHRRVPLWCNGLVPALATAGIGPRIVHLHQVPAGAQRAALAVARTGARRVLVPSEAAARCVRGAAVLPDWAARPLPAERRRGGGEVRIGFLGRLTREKGVDVLAAALARLRADSRASPRLLLAGCNRFGGAADDRAIEAALAPIADAIELPGWMEPGAFFADVDLAVFPSVAQESFGLVAAEAMAAGVPFVISDAGALPEVAGPGHPWVAPRGDAAALAAVIERALADVRSGAAAPVVAAARARWERLFCPEAGIARVRALVADLDRPRPRAAR